MAAWLLVVLAAAAQLRAQAVPVQPSTPPKATPDVSVAPRTEPELLWRINCGGPFVAAPGGPFLADQPYGAATHAGFAGGIASPAQSAGDLGPLADPNLAVHSTARIGCKFYRFDVANGAVLLRLHFAEVDVNVEGPDLRRFSVLVEGEPVLVDLDLAALFGIRYAAEFVVPVTVGDGRLDVQFVGLGTPAIVNAIEVWTLPPAVGAPPPVTGLLAKDGYGRTILDWDGTDDPAVTGFTVSRASSAAGPFTEIATTWAAPSRFLDVGAPSLVPQWYRVSALGPAGAAGPAAQVGPVVSRPPDDATLPVYELAVSAADLKALNVAVLTDPEFEVPGVFTYAGASHAVSVRYRGGGSLLASKKSWKVDFPDGDLFQGRRKLNLKATFSDHSLSIEPLAHGLFEAVGHAVTHQRRVHLFLNGEDRGVFNDVEQVDERYLAARDRAPGGSIYKGVKGHADLAVLPDPADYPQWYEKKTNESEPYDDLIALIELINAPGTTPLQLADVFDVDGYLSYIAVIGWDADSDQGARNFYLLHDKALERWEWITWDNDRAFHTPTAPINGATSECEECSGFNHLKDFVLADPGLRWRYCRKLAELMQGAAASVAMEAAIAAQHAEVATDAAADTAKFGWENDGPFESAPADLAAFTAERNAFVTGALAGYQPADPPTQLWINEFMADNRGTIADETGAFEDWVELWNADAAPLDASGLFLTDDLGQPTAWRVPDGTIVPAHGHLLVWCDNDPADGPLHATFKLDADGEELGLVAADGATLLDVIHFVPQLPDVSQGRTTDGGAFFALLPSPTPAGANTAAGHLPPLITWVEPTPAVPASSQSVTISAQVLDDAPALAVTLFWRLAGAPAFNATPMTAGEVDRWEAVVPPQPPGAQVQYYLLAQDGAGAQITEPTSAPDDLFSYGVQDLPAHGLRIAEFMADNLATITDETGTVEDWIEIFNDSDATEDLSGRFLSDTLANSTLWAFPGGTQLAPHATLLVWADDDPLDGPLHATFKLSKSGEAVALFDNLAHGNALLDAISFGPQTTDVSAGRLPDGGTVLVSFLDASPGVANVPPPGAARRYDALDPALTAPQLTALSPPLTGTSFQLDLHGAPPLAPGLLVTGLTVLHADLGAEGVLLLAPLTAAALPFTALPDGSASLALPLPDSPALVGLLIAVQAWTSGGGLSNAVAASLGE